MAPFVVRFVSRQSLFLSPLTSIILITKISISRNYYDNNVDNNKIAVLTEDKRLYGAAAEGFAAEEVGPWAIPFEGRWEGSAAFNQFDVFCTW